MGSAAVQPGLPVGTRVQFRDKPAGTGTVMPYRPEYAPGRWGLFPVRGDDGIWQTCRINDLIVLAPTLPDELAGTAVEAADA